MISLRLTLFLPSLLTLPFLFPFLLAFAPVGLLSFCLLDSLLFPLSSLFLEPLPLFFLLNCSPLLSFFLAYLFALRPSLFGLLDIGFFTFAALLLFFQGSFFAYLASSDLPYGGLDKVQILTDEVVNVRFDTLVDICPIDGAFNQGGSFPSFP